MGDNIEELLKYNIDKVSPSLIDELNSAYDEDTESYNQKKIEAFYKKHKDELETLEGYNDVDWAYDKPLKEKLKDANYTQTNENYINGLAQKYNATPEEVTKVLSELASEANVDLEKKQKAEDFKKEQEAKYNRQKAVDDYQHSYLGMDLDNPVNKAANWLADKIISDKTKQSIVEDPNNTARALANLGVDVVGTSADFAPGVGGMVVGPALRTTRDIASGDDAVEALTRGGSDLGINAAFGLGGPKFFEMLSGESKKAGEGVLKKLEEAKETMNPTKHYTPKKIEIDYSTIKNKSDLDKLKNEYPELTEYFSKNVNENVGGSAAEKAKKAVDDYNEARTKQMRVDRDYNENLDRKKKAYAEQNPKMAKVGKVLGNKNVEKAAGVTGQILGGLGKEVKKNAIYSNSTDKVKNPKKITDYDKALDYIIENTKKQWENGFKPNPIDGDIYYEAYKKWEEER